MAKANRNYVLTIEKLDGGYVTITPPFTIEFSVNKASFSGTNDFNIRIYNLSSEIRKQLRHDWTNMADKRGIVLQAGYENELGTVFNGQITDGFSSREGDSFVTTISGSDAVYALMNGQTNFTFPKGTTKEVIINTIISGMPHVSLGAIGNSYSQAINRGNTITAPPFYALQEFTQRNFCIVDAKVYTLDETEYILGSVPKIDYTTGLLGTPTRSGSLVNIEMLFEPRIKMFQGVTLSSLGYDNVNGFYKVVAIKHTGTISGAVAGDAKTMLQLSQKLKSEVKGT